MRHQLRTFYFIFDRIARQYLLPLSVRRQNSIVNDESIQGNQWIGSRLSRC